MSVESTFVKADGLNKIIDLFGYDAILCKIALFEDFSSPIYQAQIPLFDIKSNPERNKSIYFSEKILENDENIAFETNIINGIFPAETIIYSALQVAVYLGFKTIYLAGVDMNNFHLPRFYESSNNIIPSRLKIEFKDNIYPAFKHASDVMKKLNVKVINMSMDSGLDETIFEKNRMMKFLTNNLADYFVA